MKTSCDQAHLEVVRTAPRTSQDHTGLHRTSPIGPSPVPRKVDQSETGPGPVLPKFSLGPDQDWTLKHYLHLGIPASSFCSCRAHTLKRLDSSVSIRLGMNDRYDRFAAGS